VMTAKNLSTAFNVKLRLSARNGRYAMQLVNPAASRRQLL